MKTTTKYEFYFAKYHDCFCDDCEEILRDAVADAVHYTCGDAGWTLAHNLAGGYYNHDGKLVTEPSYTLTLLDISALSADALAKHLCSRFQQDSVLVLRSTVEPEFIHIHTQYTTPVAA